MRKMFTLVMLMLGFVILAGATGSNVNRQCQNNFGNDAAKYLK